MKKTLLVLAVIMLVASASFADVSFMVAPGVGQGKWAAMGMYATNHQGATANIQTADPQRFDATSLGIKGTYGLTDSWDLMGAYSMDTLASLKDLDDVIPGIKQTSGSTIGLGAKYSIAKASEMFPVDSAVMVGYQQSTVGIKSDVAKEVGVTQTTMAIAGIFSKSMGMCTPYGGVAYKILSKNSGKAFGQGTLDSQGGTGLMWNLGVWIGIAKDQAVAIEYNTENQKWDSLSKKGKAIDPTDKDGYGISVSGISLGYVYMF